MSEQEVPAAGDDDKKNNDCDGPACRAVGLLRLLRLLRRLIVDDGVCHKSSRLS